MEAAQEILKDSKDGVLGLQDELSGWFGSMEKYSGGRGAHKDRGFWLQSFNGGARPVDRITRGSSFMENVSVSILGGIQPDLIRKFASDTADDGLLQRFFPIVLRDAGAGRDEPDGGILDDYAGLIGRLYALEPPWLKGGNLGHIPVELRFDDDAQKLRNALEEQHRQEMVAWQGVNKKLAAHVGKYDGLFARLCVIWHCVENDGAAELPRLVTADTAMRVKTFLHSFLLPHALSFYMGTLGLADAHDRLAAVAGYILARRLERIANRDVQRGDRTMRKLERKDIESVFEQLDAFGWLERLPAARPGNPPPFWIVNPAVHQKFADLAESEKARREEIRKLIADAAARGTTEESDDD
jgi:hypothetical protein